MFPGVVFVFTFCFMHVSRYIRDILALVEHIFLCFVLLLSEVLCRTKVFRFALYILFFCARVCVVFLGFASQVYSASL